jgi:ABC-type Fe3+/spermidine/putrescine transport system ATPase subunit
VEIRQLQRRIGITAVYVTHDQDEALSIADQVVVMNKGLVMQVGTSETVYTSPCNLFMAEFLGKGNILKGQLSTLGEVTVAGQRLGFVARTGAEKVVTVVLRSTDIAIYQAGNADISAPDQAVLCGTVAERLFSGAICQHLIRLGEQPIFVDWASYCHDGEVRLTIPYSKVMVFLGDERINLISQDLRG